MRMDSGLLRSNERNEYNEQNERNEYIDRNEFVSFSD